MTATWTTKAGAVIPIREMEASHLLNTIRLLRRKYTVKCLRLAMSADAYSDTAPDGAAMAAESAAMEGYEEMETHEHIEREIPAMKHLLTELNRRKLEELPI